MVFKVEKNSNIVYSDLRSFQKESQIKMDPEIRGDCGYREAETVGVRKQRPRGGSLEGAGRKQQSGCLGSEVLGSGEVCSRVRLHG